MSRVAAQLYPIAVIGGGSAGVMAVLRCALNNDNCIFFPGSPKDRKRSRAMWVKKIGNIPGHFSFKKGIEDPNTEVLGWIAQSEFANRIAVYKNTGIQTIHKTPDGVFELTDSKGVVHCAEHVILCTGVMDVQPLVGDKIAPIFPFANAQSVDYCLRCDGHHVLGKETAIIGHGNGAAWVAIMLQERYRPPMIHILLNGEEPLFDDEVSELLQMYGIQVHSSRITAINGDPQAGKLAGFLMDDHKVISATMAFVSLGMIVYNDLAKQVGAALDARGFVIADSTGLSSVAGFYVAGDIMAGKKKQIYTAWDCAVDAADAINQKRRSHQRQLALAVYRATKRSD